MKINILKSNLSAFSLVEVITVVACLSIITTVAVVNVSNVKLSAKDSKLSNEVITLNSAVASYLASGGDLDSANGYEDVFRKLKTKVSNADRIAHAGFGGSVIDKRLSYRLVSEVGSSGKYYVSWDQASKRFKLNEGSSPGGIAEFYLNSELANQDFGTETRVSAVEYNRGDGWIWEYEDTAPVPQIEPTLVSLVSDTSVAPIPKSVLPAVMNLPKNANPIAAADYLPTPYENPISVDVLANDSDPDGDPLAVAFLGAPSNGQVSQSGNQVLYTPDTGFSGDDTFSYTVTDENGGFHTALVTITVEPDTGEAPRVSLSTVDRSRNILGGISDAPLFANNATTSRTATVSGWDLPAGENAISIELYWQDAVPLSRSRASRINVTADGVRLASATTRDGNDTTLPIIYYNGATGMNSHDGEFDWRNWKIQLPVVLPTSAEFRVELATGFDDYLLRNFSFLSRVQKIAATITDSDSTELASAIVRVLDLQPGDQLFVNGGTSGSGTLPGSIAWSKSSNEISLSGTSSISSYVSAIGSIGIVNTTLASSQLQRQIEVLVSDGTNQSQPAATSISAGRVD